MPAQDLAGVMAGTPVDTALGCQYLSGLGWHTLSYALSATPEEQNELQHHFPQRLQTRCLEEATRMRDRGAKLVVVFCSSLSSVLDVETMCSHAGIPILTPLDFYRDIARRFDRLAVIAANAIGLGGAEATITQHNSNAEIIGLHSIRIVRDIERQHAPQSVVVDNKIGEFTFLVEEMGYQAVLLACTHFSYIAEAIGAKTDLPVLDINQGLVPHLRKYRLPCMT